SPCSSGLCSSNVVGEVTVKQAQGLQWKLEVVDAIDENLPQTERTSIIESLIPNESMRNILI
ncbi:MAG: hypothetical protein WCD28_09535, partial [Nitrososphaeraceae archaeon]